MSAAKEAAQWIERAHAELQVSTFMGASKSILRQDLIDSNHRDGRRFG